MYVPGNVLDGLLLATVAIGASGALLAWRERPAPGAVPLAALLTTQCWWSAASFFRITAHGTQAKLLWLTVSWVGLPFIPVAWLFFALEYTGYDQYVRVRYVLVASIIPAITAVLAVTNNHYDLFHVTAHLAEWNGRLGSARTPGIWFWVIAGYTYLLGLLGAIPLLQFVTSDVSTFRGQSLAILVGLIAPWATNILFLLGVLPLHNVDPTPIAFSVSGVAYLGALTRFQLLNTSPAPIRPARRSAFERMRGGVIVLDRKDNVVDTNEAAKRAIGADPGDVLGHPVERAVPGLEAPDDRTHAGRTIFQPENANRSYDVSINQVTDVNDRTVGKIITLHDISDYLRRQQRLEVLNRVFRHNIRTNVQVIMSTAEDLTDRDEQARKVKESALEIMDLSEKIRMVLDLFERGRTQRQPTRLRTMLDENVERLQATYPDVTVHSDGVDESLAVDGLLDAVVWNVLENAAEHNPSPDPQVWIDVTRTDDGVEIEVADDGPGINDDELVLFRKGTETPLKHGSGIGLALVVWGTDIVDGEVTFEENDPTGSIVTLSVPVVS
ncbi:MAG: histidine kinase N-terminal 7TM domain-containing protein [Haloarculaceae archaeon]